MKAGCTLANLGDMEGAVRAGFDYIEFMGKYLVSLEEPDFKTLLLQMKEEGIGCLGLNGYCPKEVVIAGEGYDGKNIAEYARRCADRAAAVGAKFVGIGSPHSRMLPPGFKREESLLQLEEFLFLTAREFAPYQIVVCLEALAPCYCNFINTLKEAAAVVRRLSIENVKIVADFYNMEYTDEADQDLTEWMMDIVHVHISDDAGTHLRRSYLKPEKEKIHIARLAGLIAGGYEGTATLEIDEGIQQQQAAKSCTIIHSVNTGGSNP